MRLVDNIECVVKHAWSFKLLVLTTVLDTAQASVSFFAGSDLVSPPVLAFANMGLALAAMASHCIAQEKVSVRIPTEAGHPFRREAGQRSDLMSATIPR